MKDVQLTGFTIYSYCYFQGRELYSGLKHPLSGSPSWMLSDFRLKLATLLFSFILFITCQRRFSFQPEKTDFVDLCLKSRSHVVQSSYADLVPRFQPDFGLGLGQVWVFSHSQGIFLTLPIVCVIACYHVLQVHNENRQECPHCVALALQANGP